MSTKNLARTVIEGGRYHRNCWERRHSHAEARAQERVARADARRGADADDLVWPEARPVWKMFHDKLSPAEQWLRSQIGRPWDRVRSEIAERFDTRTLAGRHIVVDHLLPQPWDRGDTWRVSRDVHFFVDRHGILRGEVRPRRRRPLHGPFGEHEREAAAFAQGRRVAIRGTYAYWMVPAPMREPGTPRRWRQERALTEKEHAAFDALSKSARALVSIAVRE